MSAFKTLTSIQTAIKDGDLSLHSLVHFYLGQIEKQTDINAFIEVFRDEALERASLIQEKIDKGSAGRLAGLVLGLKDNICFKGHTTSASSKILENYQAIYHATAVQKLLDEDAIIIGRTNCDEFAMGGTNETSAFGMVRNPIDKSRVPGGSSGGSAAAVAADMCLAALGSDTGGSIRQPASFCNLVGLKPTYGRVSRYGLIAYGSSFDQIGPITKNVHDAASILEVIAGYDDMDNTSADKPVPDYSSLVRQVPPNPKIAYLEDPVNHAALDPEIKNRMLDIFQILESKGKIIQPVKFAYLDYLVPAYYVMAMAEASSNLARYDGIHYGYRSTASGDIQTTYTKSRSEGLGREVKRRIMTGTFVLSAGYYDAYYTKAQKARRLIYNKTMEILEKFDFILLPTTPHTAFYQGTMGEDPVALYLEDIFTTHANLVGIPAISVPAGWHSNSMPFGIQIMTRHFEEAQLLAFADYLLSLINP